MARIDFTFYGGAREFARYHGAEALLHGPASTGKTLSALWKIHLCALKYPNASIVILRKVQTTVYSTVLQSYQRKVLGGDDGAQAAGVSAYGGESPAWFDYPKGGRIWIAGLDKAGKVLSAEHDIVFVNQAEELTLEDWEILTTRTTGRAGNMPYSQTIGDCNPTYPAHWMYHRPSLQIFYSKHRDNPMLYDPATGEITEQGKHTMAVLDALTGVRRDRLRDGKAAQAEGAIYDEWDEAVHLLYDEQAPKRYHRWVAGQDWGYTNPGVLGIWGIDGDGVMWLVRQIYQTGHTVDWWAEKAVELQNQYGRFEVVACDPAEPAFIAAYREKGLNAIPADNSVVPGINDVKKRLAEKRLFILRSSVAEPDPSLVEAKKPDSVQAEVPMYVWANKTSKDVPVKEDDHGVDMMRYSVRYVDNKRGWSRGPVG